MNDTPPWGIEPQFTETSLRKLAHGGLDEAYARSQRVVPIRNASDLPTDVTWDSYLCPVPGMLFHWEHPTTGELVPQYRPDHPVTFEDGESGPKYMFPEGMHQGLGLVRKSSGTSARVAIIEGTLQGLAFARYAPADVTVYAIAGCWGWSHKDGETSTPVPELSVVDGCNVMIFVDADAGSNPDVWDGATELARAATTYGAALVGFGRVPVRGTNGMDDFLGSVAEDKRAGVVARLLDQVEQKPADRKPAAKRKRLGAADSDELPPTDDTFLGTSWADTHLDEFRVVSSDKAWIGYRDGRWSVDGAELAVAHAFLEFMTEASQPLQAVKNRVKDDPEERDKYARAVDAILSTRKRQAVTSAAMSYGPMHVRRDELDQHPNLWCAANGILDLVTLDVRPHDPRLLLTTGSDVPYLPDATCPRFDRFLDEVLPDDEVRDYVMRVFAMSMRGEVREHVLPVFIGTGRNGKGALIRIMLALFGSHGHTIQAKALLKRRFDAHAEEVAQLAGKRLVTTEETGQNSEWDVSRINEWTGGNALSGRFMHGNSFAFLPSHTLVMATNHRPTVGEGETAFWERYREVPFTQSFVGRIDLTMEPHIISNELPGVLNRLIEAGHRYRDSGLSEPAAVLVATADARVESDNLAQYCAEHLAITNDHELDRILSTELYDSVVKWWSQNVPRETPPSNRVFAKMMRQALGFAPDSDNPKKLGQGGGVRRTWTGIRWLNGGAPDAENKIEPLRQSTSAVSGSMAPENSPKADYDQGDPKKPTADVDAPTADETADVVDHESDELAGSEVGTNDTADTADKSQGVVSTQENCDENIDQQGVGDTCSLKYSGANREHRQYRQSGSIETPLEGLLVLDLETDDGGLAHTAADPRAYVRLAGFNRAGETVTQPGPDGVIEQVLSSRWVTGHNITHFDLPVLGRVDPRVDVLALTRERRVIDTLVIDPVLNPVVNDKRAGEVGRILKHFGLDISCQRHGVAGKTADLSALAKEHGGYGQIPLDVLEPYLRGDVAASQGLTGVLMAQMMNAPERLREYAWREHRVHAIASVMGAEGLHVDQELLQRRYWTTADQKYRRTLGLISRYQIPTTKADGKKADSPAATKGGKTALLTAFHALGVNMASFPKTAKGAPAFGREPMVELAEAYAGHPNGEEIGLLAETVADINGSRTVYATAMAALHDDGRVHPRVVTLQASGRWSISEPGLTVFGKRGGKVVERAVFDTADDTTALLTIDLSQVDARAVAVHSQDHAYMDIFGMDPETGEPRDSHAEVALAVWGDPKLRDRAKPISHGWNYGMQLDKLAETAGSREVAEHFNAAMEANFPRLVTWKREMAQIAGVQGAVMDNGFGRQLRPDPPRAFTQGPALIGQGCARDLMAQCLLNIDDFDAKNGTRIIRMLRAQVHDEALFEVPREHAEAVALIIESCFNFEWAPRPDMRPIAMIAKVDRHKDGRLKLGRNWAECY